MAEPETVKSKPSLVVLLNVTPSSLQHIKGHGAASQFSIPVENSF